MSVRVLNSCECQCHSMLSVRTKSWSYCIRPIKPQRQKRWVQIPCNSKSVQQSLNMAATSNHWKFYFKKETRWPTSRNLSQIWFAWTGLNANHSVLSQSDAIFTTKAGPSDPQNSNVLRRARKILSRFVRRNYIVGKILIHFWSRDRVQSSA